MNEKLTEGVAYLKGLAEGMEISEESKEGKLIYAIIDMMGQFAKVIQGMEVAHDELNDYVESIDDDLSDLENELLNEKDDDDDDDDFDTDDYLASLSMFNKKDDGTPTPLKRIFDDGDDDFPDNNDDDDDDDEE